MMELGLFHLLTVSCSTGFLLGVLIVIGRCDWAPTTDFLTIARQETTLYSVLEKAQEPSSIVFLWPMLAYSLAYLKPNSSCTIYKKFAALRNCSSFPVN